MMDKTTVTSKGQITIPKRVRDQMGLRPGDQIEFVKEDGAFKLRKVMETSPFDKWVGYLEHMRGVDPDEVIEEMRGR